jgi:hypothetical protein
MDFYLVVAVGRRRQQYMKNKESRRNSLFCDGGKQVACIYQKKARMKQRHAIAFNYIVRAA